MLKYFILIFLQSSLTSSLSEASSCQSLLSLAPYVSVNSISRSQKKILSTRPPELKHLIHREILLYTKSGNLRFISNSGQFVFQDSMVPLKNASGVTRDAIYRAYYNGQKYVIKQLSLFFTTEQLALKEVQNAKLMSLLDLGPQTHLVTRGERNYLIMHEAPGVNIKEILDPFMATPTTNLNIRRMLNLGFDDGASIRKKFAQAFLNSTNLMTKLDLIQKQLEDHSFTRIRDFQFMVDLGSIKPSLNIIDVASFRRFEEHPDPSFTPKAVIFDLVQELKRLATF